VQYHLTASLPVPARISPKQEQLEEGESQGELKESDSQTDSFKLADLKSLL